MTQPAKHTTFLIDGGIGRQFAAIPALEKFEKNNKDDNFIFIGEPGMFKGSSLYNRVFDRNHKGLLELIRHTNIISPEPYLLNKYINQECNILRAFDIIINGVDKVDKSLKLSKIYTSKSERQVAQDVINKYAKKSNLPILVFQPLGRSAEMTDSGPIDTNSRSFEALDIIRLLDELSPHFNIIPMAEYDIAGSDNPIIPDLRVWYDIIKKADVFLGCDSVGQHFAESLGTKGLVVLGSTFPENVSYVNSKTLKIFDKGKSKGRVYSPFRL